MDQLVDVHPYIGIYMRERRKERAGARAMVWQSQLSRDQHVSLKTGGGDTRCRNRWGFLRMRRNKAKMDRGPWGNLCCADRLCREY